MRQGARDPVSRPVLVFDSGIGGLSVLRHIRAGDPALDLVYAADHAGFPYGGREAEELLAHVVALLGRLIDAHDPCAVVIACNTVSTLVLPALRARFSVPFIGTVPAIKPAAAQTRSGLITVLATAGTVKRDYTFDLIRDFAPEVAVTLQGSAALVRLAEAKLAGEAVADDAIARELAPCFVDRDGTRTDTLVLACTHFPFLLDEFVRLAPWPVGWIDPAPAIARRVSEVLARGLARGEGTTRYVSTWPPARFPESVDAAGRWQPFPAV
ncbi:glutamate racemase [Breoghania sp. L-A4]|uniref:glutamate racemase n=1 Tax=Breoghania sp. L-A4 TaxID=2304600 RepID=UPI000E35B59A|nr:glutamate racemase [Breoghania sp. L-A4]AXS42652.1 glutamate racemase [Breoghania sp. L-A4]